MKAILFDRDIQEPISFPPGMTLISDSAITLSGRPVFLPDFDTQWTAEFYIALKVCRLGKSISEKFAHRYYDRCTIAMRLVPTNVTSELRTHGRPTAICDIFDNALTLGNWVDICDIPETVTATIGDESITINGLKCIADNAISNVSRYTTLKIGDAIMLGRLTAAISVERGTQVHATIENQECLSLKIH